MFSYIQYKYKYCIYKCTYIHTCVYVCVFLYKLSSVQPSNSPIIFRHSLYRCAFILALHICYSFRSYMYVIRAFSLPLTLILAVNQCPTRPAFFHNFVVIDDNIMRPIPASLQRSISFIHYTRGTRNNTLTLTMMDR